MRVDVAYYLKARTRVSLSGKIHISADFHIF
jgi:hypothetical protein